MTLEEAKKLKPGDRVLVEAIIQEVLLDDINLTSEYISFCNIREKIKSPRRKFKAGDIVQWDVPNGYMLIVQEDEDESGIIKANFEAQYRIEHLKLVCPVEGRLDRKGGEA